MTFNTTENRPTNEDNNDTEKYTTNAGEVLEKLNGTSSMTQNMPIDGDDGITEIAITNAGEIIKKHRYSKRNCILLLFTKPSQKL